MSDAPYYSTDADGNVVWEGWPPDDEPVTGDVDTAAAAWRKLEAAARHHKGVGLSQNAVEALLAAVARLLARLRDLEDKRGEAEPEAGDDRWNAVVSGTWSAGEPPTRVEPRGTHWARKAVAYADQFMFLMEAVGLLAAELNEDADPNSPWTHEAVRDRAREVERWAASIGDSVDGLFPPESAGGTPASAPHSSPDSASQLVADFHYRAEVGWADETERAEAAGREVALLRARLHAAKHELAWEVEVVQVDLLERLHSTTEALRPFAALDPDEFYVGYLEIEDAVVAARAALEETPA